MTLDHKKKLGAYYTPITVTDVLSKWAIRDKNDKILEPSFGGCNFLTSSLGVLKGLGTKSPSQKIYGFDIDSKAFDILQEKKIDSSNFYLQDFLNTKGLEYPVFNVDVVLGNPPYLPIHKLDEDYKKAVYALFKKHEIKIPKRSSLWIYFIVNSLKFIVQGGRMAWVVPGSISFTNYGLKFLNQISSYFKEVKLINIDERYFSETGTKEKTSFLLCEGYKTGSCKVERYNFTTLKEALNAITNGINFSKINSATDISNKLKNRNENFATTTLGVLFNIRIGIVIGATKLLVHNFNNAQLTNIPMRYYYPILTKGKQLSNLLIKKNELIADNNLQIYLLNAIKLQDEDPSAFKDFLANFPSKILINQTFKNRQSLFGYDDFKHPDAFLTFYSQGLPKFIINYKKELNCSNSIHRLYFKESGRHNQVLLKFISLQMFCSFLANEIRDKARQYGNSILKYEPSDAAKIPIMIPIQFSADFKSSLTSVFDKVYKMILSGNEQQAKLLAFNYISETIS